MTARSGRSNFRGNFEWTDEAIATIRRLWTAGDTCRQIAEALGPSCTRNAVIGKAHKLKLKPRRKGSSAVARDDPDWLPAKRAPMSDVRRRSNFRRPPTPRTPAPEPPGFPPQIEEPMSLRLTLMQLTDQTCRWPDGDPRSSDFHFCGHPPQAGKPYCPGHAVMSRNSIAAKVTRTLNPAGQR